MVYARIPFGAAVGIGGQCSMNSAGLQEFFLVSLTDKQDGRLWRTVPRRKWYSQKRGETPGAQEVVLFFKKARHVIDTSSYALVRPLTS
jgi:hypothetical protein